MRNLISSNSDLLGASLAADSQAADRWATDAGGEYLAAGTQTGIAGIRADLAIIDDPFASKEDAYSQRTRDRVWEWYINDLGPRLKPNAKRVIMHTRWHLDDLAGRVIEHAKGTNTPIRVVKIPAICDSEDDPLHREIGEYLWDEPEGYNYGASLRARQRELSKNPIEWAALYQQDPVPEGGGYFKKEWFKYYDELPPSTRAYGASDYAVTADGGDYTVHAIAVLNGDGKIYIKDLWRAQASTDVWADVLLDMGSRHEVMDWAEEKGQIEKSVGPFIAKRAIERNIFFNRKQFTSVADKATRAQSFRGRLSQGRVYFPRHASWLPTLEAELLTFPLGKHDDQVDVMSLFGRMLDEMYPPDTTDDAKVKDLMAALKKRVR